MDEASRQVSRFLEALSDIVWDGALVRGEDSLQAKLTRRGFPPIRGYFPRLITHSHPRFGLVITASARVTAEKQLDFGIVLSPGAEGWTIETDVFLDLWPEGEGQRSMGAFPTRHASTLDECLTQLERAVVALAACDEVLAEVVELGLVDLPDTH